MSEWWTYRPADLLMYSPDVYWRLFADLNRSWWPIQPLIIGSGLGWLYFCTRRAGQCADHWPRSAAAICAACWAVAAWSFLWQRFAPINWIAGHVAVLFAVEAALLAAVALRGAGWFIARGPRLWCGLAFGLWALLVHPILAPIFDRPWIQAEIFGLAPDPTAIGTLALLLLIDARTPTLRRQLRLLWPIPVAWCCTSAAVFWTQQSAQGWLMLAAAVLPPGMAVWHGRRRRQSPTNDPRWR